MTHSCGCGCACGNNSKIVEIRGGKRCDTYDICKPGHYVFKNNIAFWPSEGGKPSCCFPSYQFACDEEPNLECPVGVNCGPGDDTAVLAIRISASNVVLDLSGFELSQGNALPFVRGIQIERDVTNVQLLNGTIRGFSQWGLRVRGDSKDVTLRNLTITKNGFNNPETYTRFQSAMGAVALGESRYFDLGGANDEHLRILENVYMDQVRVVDNYFIGMYVGRIKNLQAQDSNFDDTYRNLVGATTGNSNRLARFCYPLSLSAGGFDRGAPIDGATGDLARDFVVEHVSFKNCSFNGARNDTIAPPGAPDAFAAARCEVANAHDVLFQNCEWRNYHAVGGQATAIDHDGAIGISYIDCLISDMISTYSFAEGIHLSGSTDRFVFGVCAEPAENRDLQVSGTTIRRIHGKKSGQLATVGIFAWTVNGDVTNTIIEDVKSEEAGVCGIQILTNAIPPRTDSLNWRIRDCHITNLSAGTDSQGIQIFDVPFNLTPNPKTCKNFLIENTYISDVLSSGVPNVSNGPAYGIRLIGGPYVDNSIIRSCQISQIRPTINLLADNSYAGVSVSGARRTVIEDVTVVDSYNGIYLNNTVNAVLKDNKVQNCDGNGYFDSAANASTSLLLNNLAYNNTTNYSVTYAVGALQLLTRTSPGDNGTATAGYRDGVDNVSVD